MSYTVPQRASSCSSASAPSRRRNSDTCQYDDDESVKSSYTETGASATAQSYHSPSGFHVQVPESKKNSKLRQNARQEEELYKQYKETKKKHIVAEMNSQGGTPLSVEEQRRKRELEEKETRKAAILRRMEREERRKEQIRQDKEKDDEFKRKQREKSEKLEHKKSITDAQRREEVRSKRLAYFS